jgi:hypothetical protein
MQLPLRHGVQFPPEMQSLKIVLTCIVAAIVCGIVHDLFTAHICVEYFSVFHPRVFATQSPTWLALGWGVIATWWAGVFLGTLLAISARAGSWRKINAGELVRPISRLSFVMALLATVAGSLGYFLERWGVVAPPIWVASVLSPARHARFMADWWAHNTSYLVGSLGGVVLCVLTIRRRATAAISRG